MLFVRNENNVSVTARYVTAFIYSPASLSSEGSIQLLDSWQCPVNGEQAHAVSVINDDCDVKTNEVKGDWRWMNAFGLVRNDHSQSLSRSQCRPGDGQSSSNFYI